MLIGARLDGAVPTLGVLVGLDALAPLVAIVPLRHPRSFAGGPKPDAATAPPVPLENVSTGSGFAARCGFLDLGVWPGRVLLSLLRSGLWGLEALLDGEGWIAPVYEIAAGPPNTGEDHRRRKRRGWRGWDGMGWM